MKYLPLDLISLELISSSDTSSNRLFKVHDIYTTNRLKDKSALVATKYLNLKLLCEGENENPQLECCPQPEWCMAVLERLSSLGRKKSQPNALDICLVPR